MSGWTEARTIPADDLHQHVGQNFFSHWFVVDQDRIDAFARVTEDEEFIHVDPAQASLTPFGGTVAHGFLTLSLLSSMAYSALPKIEGAAMGVNYGLDRARFLHPVRSGSRVRGRFLLTAVIRRSEREWQLSYDISVELLIRLLVRGQKIAKRMFESNCPPLEAIGVIFATRASQFNHFKNRSRCYGHVVSTRESAWPFRAAAVTNAEAKRANAQSGQRNQLHDR